MRLILGLGQDEPQFTIVLVGQQRSHARDGVVMIVAALQIPPRAVVKALYPENAMRFAHIRGLCRVFRVRAGYFDADAADIVEGVEFFRPHRH